MLDLLRRESAQRNARDQLSNRPQDTARDPNEERPYALERLHNKITTLTADIRNHRGATKRKADRSDDTYVLILPQIDHDAVKALIEQIMEQVVMRLERLPSGARDLHKRYVLLIDAFAALLAVGLTGRFHDHKTELFGEGVVA